MPDGTGFIMWSGLQRLELYVFVFAGTLLFAVSAIGLLKRRGKQVLQSVRKGATGDKLVDLLALALCIWLGYGFVTEPTQTPGVEALLAVSFLAAALGVHLMLTSHDEHHGHTPAHCGIASSRRGASLRVELDVDPLRAQPFDDFTQRWTWTTSQHPSHAQRASSARHVQAVARVRSRQRYWAKRH
jgi:hypothetical protein